jgi:hypothetical protein
MNPLPTFVAALFAVVTAGCVYEAPFTADHTIPIDTAVPGLWEAVPEPGTAADPDARMVVLGLSESEYLVHYPTSDHGIYYRAYPVKVGDREFVQLQAVGTAEGPVKPDEKKLFHAVSYRMVGGQLEVKTLNTKLVSDEAKDADALRKAFLEKQDRDDLFIDPVRFRRMER